MNKILRPVSDTLGNLLDELAARHPEKEAIVFGRQRISYKNLQDKANTLACSLIDLGVKPGDRVALLAPNRPEWIIATFAIAKIGGNHLCYKHFLNAHRVILDIEKLQRSCAHHRLIFQRK
jgi:acyl-CoA synthetase (AMP-forming)/AMP-acid ligase II